MPTVLTMRNAGLMLIEFNQYTYYFFDTGYVFCLRPEELEESTLTLDDFEALPKDAMDMIDAGADIYSGEVPGWVKCKRCDEVWVEDDCIKPTCDECIDYEYRMAHG